MALELHGLRTVIYPAPDLDAAASWWAELLGRQPYFRESFYVGFDVGGYELGLLPDAAVEDGAQVYWGVDNVALALERAVDAGADVIAPATEVGEGIVTACVRTPGGSVVGFIVNPHFTGR